MKIYQIFWIRYKLVKLRGKTKLVKKDKLIKLNNRELSKFHVYMYLIL